MADIAEIQEYNAPGPFFVDITCNDCGACPVIAPNHFRRHTETGQCFVSQQPKQSDEIEQCRSALKSCPSQSIGWFGED